MCSAPGNGAAAQMIVLLEGPLETPRLWSALDKLVERHKILRTVFAPAPGSRAPYHQVRQPGLTLASQEADLRPFGAIRQNEQIEDLIQAGARLDPSRGATVQAWLVQLTDDRRILLLSLPALYSDSLGLKNMVRELAPLYAGYPALPPVSQYAEYCEQQHELLRRNHAAARAGRDFWQHSRWREVPQLSLPFVGNDSPQLPFSPKTVHIAVNPTLLGELAESTAGEFSDVLLATWQILLGRLSGQQEIVTACLSHGRTAPAWRDAIGAFARTLPLYANLHADQSFTEVVRQSSQARTNAEKWQDYFPASTTAFISPAGFLQEERLPKLTTENISFSIIWENLPSERFQLQMRFSQEETPWVDVAYNPDAVARPVAEQMTRRIPALLRAAALHPEAPICTLPVMDEGERRRVLYTFNQTRSEYPSHSTVPALFEEQVEKGAELPALQYQGQVLSYGELNARANQLAHALGKLGVASGSRVGLALEMSADLVVAVLGILKAGACCAPVLPGDSGEGQENAASARLCLVRRQSAAALAHPRSQTIEWKILQASLPSEAADNPGRARDPEQAAFVGDPDQGAPIRHQDIINAAHFFRRRLGGESGPALQLAVTAPLPGSLSSLFPCLISGGLLHVLDHEVSADRHTLGTYLRRHHIDVLCATSSQAQSWWGELSAEPMVLPNRYLLISGEPLAWEFADRLRKAGHCQLIQYYQPAKAPFYSCTFQLQDDDARCWSPESVPIGRPIANVRACILDELQQPVPIGVTGLLYLGRIGQEAGQESTPADSLLCTGDLACFLPDGNIALRQRREIPPPRRVPQTEEVEVVL
ncbi:MAG: AMP-binding protein [Acidobacteria bacterium]|nr:AMP-binding protein [Acidobacteriota bacterium]